MSLEYKLKSLLTFGEVRKIRSVMAEFAEITEKFTGKKISDLTNDEFLEFSRMAIKNNESDQIMADTLTRCYGLNEIELAQLSYQEALSLFSQLYIDSTNIKKKLDQPSN